MLRQYLLLVVFVIALSSQEVVTCSGSALLARLSSALLAMEMLQSLLEKPRSKGFFQRARERWANKLPLRAELQPDQDATARLCTFNS